MRVYDFAAERLVRRPGSKPYHGPSSVSVHTEATGGVVSIELLAGGATPVYRDMWPPGAADTIGRRLVELAAEARRQGGAT